MNATATPLTELVATNKARLDTLKPLTKEKLTEGKPEDIAAAFDLLTTADLNAAALEAAHPDQAFGFGKHDVRFMRSLRDQVLGNEQPAKPLTKAQLRTLRTILMRDSYTTQLALLTPSHD